MSTPILLVTGFLGAGKTTLINDLLHSAEGERIAAIVNDFGAINIDAELLSGAADQVVGLKNGCICCTLQGDLLRTLRLVLGQEPKPDRIIIEASGAADPRGIMEMIHDPVLWGIVSLDAVVSLIDAAECSANPARMSDPLWRAQALAADFLLLSKADGLPDGALSDLHAKLALLRRPVYEAGADAVPVELLFGRYSPTRHAPEPGRISADRFVSLEWQSDRPLSATAFQEGLESLTGGLLRAKGWLCFAENPQARHLFQLAGRRAAFSPAPDNPAPGCQLVMIGERDSFDPDAARALLTGMIA